MWGILRAAIRNPAILALVLGAAVFTGCDFWVDIRVENQASVPAIVEINDSGHRVTVNPGERAHFTTGVNTDLRKIRVELEDEQRSTFEQEFTRRRGYRVTVVITGPPLQVIVTTKGL